MRRVIPLFVASLLILVGLSLQAQTLKPSVGNITPTGFTLQWTTTQALNTQAHYGVGQLSTTVANWALTENHVLAVTGLKAGTSYLVEVESSYYSNPDWVSSTFSVTTQPLPPSGTSSGSGSSGSSSGSSSSSSTSPVRLLTSASANWLYSAPRGTGLNISATTKGMTFAINVHTGGFDYPVQYTDGTHGCTTFTDTEYYNFNDRICVPNPPGGYAPSVGGWGANDGHLVIVDTANNMYYDFWKLIVNGSGQPTITNIGQIVSGSLSTSNGTPGTTAAVITGLAGDILPGELNCETCLQHALSVIVPGTMNSNRVGTQAPAEKTDGSVKGAVFREGSKISFDPSVNVDSLNVSTAVKAIMKALQQYGGVITDQTGGTAIAFYSALATVPDTTGINLIGQHLLIYY